MGNWMKGVAALLALTGSGVALGQDCDSNQAAMNVCAANDFKAADKELNELYKTQMDYLQDVKTKSAFKDAQRKWIALRDADCLYQVGPREDSGSIWALLQFSCETEQTKLRIEQLKKYVACRQDMCPN